MQYEIIPHWIIRSFSRIRKEILENARLYKYTEDNHPTRYLLYLAWHNNNKLLLYSISYSRYHTCFWSIQFLVTSNNTLLDTLNQLLFFFKLESWCSGVKRQIKGIQLLTTLWSGEGAISIARKLAAAFCGFNQPKTTHWERHLQNVPLLIDFQPSFSTLKRWQMVPKKIPRSSPSEY